MEAQVRQGCRSLYLLLVPHYNSVQTQQLGNADPCLVAHTATSSLDQQIIRAGRQKVHQEVFA